MRAIAEHQYWDTFMILSIFLNAILLILDSPLNDPDSDLSNIYLDIGKGFTILFTIEMAIKIIAFGLLINNENPNDAYLKSPWNILDCVIVIVKSHFHRVTV
jgi:hypothetical protein